MVNIIFEVPQSVAENFGPMRYDLEVPGLQCVIHMKRHPPGETWAGDPCLLVTALPCPHENDTHYVHHTMPDDKWELALAGWDQMHHIKAAMDELNRRETTKAEWEPLFLKACDILGFDPN